MKLAYQRKERVTSKEIYNSKEEMSSEVSNAKVISRQTGREQESGKSRKGDVTNR